MRKILVIALMFAATVLYAQADNTIQIKGKIDGIERGTMHLLVRLNDSKTDTLASVPFKRSRFDIIAELSEPMVTQLMIEGYQGGFTIIAEPGAVYKALLTNDNRTYIKGGALNDAYTAHLAKSDSLGRIIQDLQQRYDDVRKSGKFRSASSLNDTLKQHRVMLQQITTEFLRNHDDIITAYTYLANITLRDMALQDTKRVYESMGPGAKSSHCGRMIKERIDLLEKTAHNAMAPDFTAYDLNGNPVKMSEVPGKVKIIDFWASWCGPCRLNNPSLKKLYEKFHDKGLEIIGVSLDNKVENWKNAVEKDGLTWVNVSTLQGWACEVARLYNVKAVPALFVLDSENRIIATGLRGEKLSLFIEEKLK